MRDSGCRRAALLADGSLFASGIRGWVRRGARRVGLRIVLDHKIAPRATRYTRLAHRVRRAQARCVVFAGMSAPSAVRLFGDLDRALPHAGLFASSGLARRAFTDPRRGGVPAGVGRRMVITSSVLATSGFPPAGQDFFRRYSARYGDPNPDPDAVYGYEAMRVVLDAVAAVGPRPLMMIRWLRMMPIRSGPIRTYRFDRFGDTTARSFGLYRISDGALAYAGAIQAQ